MSRLSVMNPEEVARVAINGLLSGKVVIIPGRLNKFFMLLDKFLPTFFKKILIGGTMKKLDTNNRLARYLVPAMATVPISNPRQFPNN